MSLQSAQEFIHQANQDQVIRKLARERFGDIVNVGREHGYDFELDEFEQAMRERRVLQAAYGEGPDGEAVEDGGEAACTGSSCQCGSTYYRPETDSSSERGSTYTEPNE